MASISPKRRSQKRSDKERSRGSFSPLPSNIRGGSVEALWTFLVVTPLPSRGDAERLNEIVSTPRKKIKPNSTTPLIPPHERRAGAPAFVPPKLRACGLIDVWFHDCRGAESLRGVCGVLRRREPPYRRDEQSSRDHDCSYRVR